MAVYLAVDAAGSKSECLIADEDRVLSRVQGRLASLSGSHAQESIAQLRQLVQDASQQAGVPLYLVQRSCIALPGLGEAGVRSWAEGVLRSLLPCEAVLKTGEDLAFESAFGDHAGVVVFAGRTSAVIGRSSQGARFRAGGWGLLPGDEGSAGWIGLEGVRAGLRCLDRGLQSSLLREIQAAWGITRLGDLLTVVQVKLREAPEGLEELSATVVRCAASGDLLAQTVLRRAGEELGTLVGAVLGKMLGAGCRPDDLRRLAFAGDVLTQIAPVREALMHSLELAFPVMAMDQEGTDVLLGALARARRG